MKPHSVISLIVSGYWFITLCFTTLYAQKTQTSQERTIVVDSLYQSLEMVHDNFRRAGLYTRLAWEQRTSNPVESILAAQNALSLAHTLKNDSLIGVAHRFMSVAYRNMGDYTKAAENAYKALERDEIRGDSLNIGHSYNTISGILRYQKDIVKAEAYAHQALLIAERLNEKKLTAYALLNLSEVLYEQALYSTALINAERALRIWQELKQPNYIAVVKSVIAKELFALGKPQDGRKYVFEALQIFEQLGQFHDIALVLNRLAKHDVETRSYAEAEKNASRAYEIASKIHAQFQQQEAAKILATTYQEQGKYKEALEYFKIHETIHDSMYADAASRNAQLLSIEYETDKKEKQLEILREKERVNLISRTALIATIVLVLVILSMLYARYKKISSDASYINVRAEELADLNNELRIAHFEAEDKNRSMRLAQLEIQDQNLRLSELNEEKNMILGMVSHDLKNPIVAVQGLAEMMMNEDFSSEQYKEFANVIHQTSSRMFHLVRTFLDFSRMEDGKVQLKPIDFDLNSVVSMMVQDYRRSAEAKSMALHFSPYFEPLNVLADETATKQILDNLISNAIKYTPRGKNVAVRILPIQTLPQGLVLMREDLANLDELEFEAKTSHIRVEIMDEGPGLTDEDKAKLFGKFARLSAQPTGGESSTGLGLAIAKKLTEMMHGRIWCDSEYGEGAVFCLELPIAT